MKLLCRHLKCIIRNEKGEQDGKGLLPFNSLLIVGRLKLLIESHLGLPLLPHFAHQVGPGL